MNLKHLFIDSNIWLSLYHYSSDDLEQFKKLKGYIGKTIKLYIPMQTHDEVYRNRDAKILDSLKKFREFSITFPNFTKSYPEYSDFSGKYSSLKAQHTEWLRKIESDIQSLTLPADNAINDFFTYDSLFPCDKEIVDAGILRYNIGNPPGKDGKYGDAINWECLLKFVPDESDLYFISNDKDYASPVDEKQFNVFLRDEWMQKKSGRVIFYKSLVSFLKDHASFSIKLEEEQSKEELISDLLHSRSFATTHAIIKSLSEYHEWSDSQTNDLLDAALNNNQVGWILRDEDVAAFYEKLAKGFASKSPKAIEVIKEIQGENEGTIPPIDTIDIPF